MILETVRFRVFASLPSHLHPSTSSFKQPSSVVLPGYLLAINESSGIESLFTRDIFDH